MLMSHYLATTRGRHGVLAACASLLAFDTYMRPGETLAVQRGHVVRPKSRKYSQWATVICPSTEAKLAKNRERDDTIVVGLDVEDRTFVPKILEALVDACPHDAAPLIPLPPVVYVELVRHVAAALGLTALKISPHTWEARRGERGRVVRRALACGHTAQRTLEGRK